MAQGQGCCVPRLMPPEAHACPSSAWTQLTPCLPARPSLRVRPHSLRVRPRSAAQWNWTPHTCISVHVTSMCLHLQQEVHHCLTTLGLSSHKLALLSLYDITFIFCFFSLCVVMALSICFSSFLPSSLPWCARPEVQLLGDRALSVLSASRTARRLVGPQVSCWGTCVVADE